MQTSSPHSSSTCLPRNPQQRRLPWRIWLYTLSFFLKSLLILLFVFAAMFILNDLREEFQDFSKAQATTATAMRYFAWRLPQHLLQVIPLAVMLSSAVLTVVFRVKNDFVAMHAIGLRLSLCLLPVWLTALGCSAISFYISEVVAPAGLRQADALHFKVVESRKGRKKATELVYKSQTGRRDWFFADFRPGGLSRGVVLTQFDNDGIKLWMLTASAAEYRDDIWNFHHGTVHEFLYPAAQLLPERRLRQAFTTLTVPPEWLHQAPLESPALMQASSKQLIETSLGDLQTRLQHTGAEQRIERNRVKTLIWHRLTSPLASLIGALLGFAIGMASWREKDHVSGALLAVVAYVLYVLLAQMFLTFGINNWLPPFFAGAGTSIAFLLWGAWLTARRH